jgi:hypothetical protein
VGYQAGYSNTTGTELTAIGKGALYTNSTGNYNTAVGYQTMRYNTTGSDNTAYGDEALRGNTSGGKNTVSGNIALYANTTGSNNVAFGMQALRFNTTASNNTAVGYQAGYDNTTGTNLVLMGVDSGANNTTGQGNTFLGRASGLLNTTGSYNCFVGQSASSGYASGYLMTTGWRNTILGAYNGNQGGLDIRTSNNNIVLSDGAGNPRFTIDGDGDAELRGLKVLFLNTQTGDQGGLVVRNGSNNTNATCIQFQGYNSSVTGTITTVVNSTSYNTSSDYRLKENIVDLTDATARLKQIPVKRFNWISDSSNTTIDGFIAHEVATIVPEAITGEKDAVYPDVFPEGNSRAGTAHPNAGKIDPQGIDQSKLVPLLVATIQELEARITALEGA